MINSESPFQDETQRRIPALLMRLTPWLLLVVGMLATVLYWQHENAAEKAHVELRFNAINSKMLATAQRRLSGHETVLRAVRGLFEASGKVTPTIWNRFIQALELKQQFPGVRTIFFAEQVSKADRAHFIQRMVRTYGKEFEIISEEERDPSIVVTHSTTVGDLTDWVELYLPGFDLAAEQRRRRTAELARDTRLSALSKALERITSRGAETELLHLFPVFATNRDADQSENALEKSPIIGWLGVVYGARDLFRHTFQGVSAEIRVEVFDSASVRPENRIYDSHYYDSDEKPINLEETGRLTLGSGVLSLRSTPTAFFQEQYLNHNLILIIPAGWAISATLAFAAWALISSRRQALEQALRMTRVLRESEEQLRRALHWAPIPVMMHTSGGLITHINLRWHELSGYGLEDVPTVRAWVSLVCAPAQQSNALNCLSPPLELDEPLRSGEVVIRTAHGRTRVWHIQSRPLGSFSDGREMIISLANDVTARIQTEETLRQAKSAAERANRAKSEFLATMSHEIRTPMNAIIGMAEVLAETELTPDQRDYLAVFQRAGDTLLALINDILDLSKVEAGQLALDCAIFHPREILQRVQEMMIGRAEERGLRLELKADPAVPDRLVGDSRRLRQILINLVGNALKFTHQGSIQVEMRLDPENSSPANLLFEVKDTGIGIPTEKHESIFEPFTQADTTTTRRYGGTGLGLTIVSRLVGLMGGRIWVESQPDRGSVFRFTVQLQLANQEEETVQKSDNVQQFLRVLVIDEQADSRLVLSGLVGSLGAQVSLVGDWNEGIDLLRGAQQDKTPFTVVIASGTMGGNISFPLVEALRRESAQPKLPVILVSSSHQDGDLVLARRLGIGLLLKPLKRSELKAALASALSETPAQKLPADERRSLRLLLVDDSEDNVLLLRAFLKNTPHTLEVRCNGLEGVEAVQNNSYDVVLMDVQMPVMDGYQATREIRAWEQSQQRAPIPILALTANAFDEDRQKSLDAGCSGHLTKPISKQRLLEALGLPSFINPAPQRGQAAIR